MTKEKAIELFEYEIKRYEGLVLLHMSKDNFVIANSYGDMLAACRLAVSALKGEL